jgi:hypothetical protein
MEQHAGQQNTAVFAAEGSARHHIGRVAVAAAATLLAAWMIALALGVLGGFDSLPGLPSSHSKGSSEASSSSPPHRQVEAPIRAQHVVTQTPTVSPPSPSSGSSQPQSHGSSPKTSSPQTVQAPTPTVATPTSHGQGATHANTTTGKPIGSPGNSAGGTGAPGQLR